MDHPNLPQPLVLTEAFGVKLSSEVFLRAIEPQTHMTRHYAIDRIQGAGCKTGRTFHSPIVEALADALATFIKEE